MAELGRFFDGPEYGSQDFAEFFTNFLSTGFFKGLEVEANDSMTVTLKEGSAFIEGYEYRNTDDLSLTHDTANATDDRIDRVVIRLDRTPDADNPIEAVIRKGVASTTPEAPELVRDTSVFEISLAQVLINAGSSVIDTSQITDERGDINLCGRVGNAGRITQQVDSVDVRPPSTPAGQFREGNTNFYVHGIDHSDVMDEWFDSLPVSPSTYNRDREDLRMYIETVSRRNNTGLQTVTIFDFSSSEEYQIYGQFVRASNRVTSEGLWGRWQEVVLEFDRGESSSGQYVKYTNGDMECTFEDSVTTQVQFESSNGEWWHTKTFSFPQPFAERPKVVAFTNREASIQWAAARQTTTTDTELYLLGVNSDTSGYLSYQAKGRWR